MTSIRKLAAASTLAACALTYVGNASADDGRPAGGGLGLSVGTGGIGIDYVLGLTPYLDVRAGYDFGTLALDREEDGIDYDADLDFSSARLMLDLRPFAGGFRLSAGYYTGTPELKLEAAGVDDYDIGGRTYTGDIQLLGDIDLGSGAPYLGIGWGGTSGTRGFGMSLDIGVLFTDNPAVGLVVPRGRACDATLQPGCDPNSITGFDVTGSSPQAQIFQAELEAERQNLEDEAADYDLWPILRLGMHWRF